MFVASDTVNEYKSEDEAIHVIERRCKLDIDAPRLLKKVIRFAVPVLYFWISFHRMLYLNRVCVIFLRLQEWIMSTLSRRILWTDVKGLCI